MSYNSISKIPTQFSTGDNVLAAGYYLKLYQAGTTTPIAMAIDTAASSTLDKAKLSTKGYPLSNPADDDSVFIPHINQAYKIVLYRTETGADADNSMDAEFTIDNLDIFDGSSLAVNEYTTLTADDVTLIVSGLIDSVKHIEITSVSPVNVTIADYVTGQLFAALFHNTTGVAVTLDAADFVEADNRPGAAIIDTVVDGKYYIQGYYDAELAKVVLV